LDFLPGTVAAGGGMPVFRVDAAAFPLSIPVAGRLAQTAAGIELAIRPEHVQLGAQGIAATVRLVQPVGPSTFVTVAWPGGELVARLPGMVQFAPGEAVHFGIDDEAHMMFFDGEQGRHLPTG
ncbi:MAG: TOBE domain-containing protein, partial [Dongiaceae bacterium]